MNIKSALLVLAQFILIWLVLSPISHIIAFRSSVALVGGLIILAGGLLILWSAVALRRINWSVLPEPVAAGTLIVRGPYHYIRHPMYSAVILIGLGAVIAQGSALNALYFVLLVVVLLIKIEREEMLLKATYQAYEAYVARSNKLIPKLY